MNYEIRIQEHMKVYEYIGHDKIELGLTKEEYETRKKNAVAKYKTEKWEAEQSGVKAVYVAAFTPQNEFLGGICFVNEKKQQMTFHEDEHEKMKSFF